ncbi:hypothetical protein NA56DRAFT_697571 [Hyaloscypha hepaticicola]|uniref:Uncharacterized protein n=1 Tax=Hyaloscypha hepaticicola TaxID=2082293 RepID=A0A2J6QMA9_9HELO|nr:hypothetical protein NA56DRAFT_697571 [Hyaloscypha hepaticicola]
MGTKLQFHLSSGKLSGYRVYLRNASTTKYISLSILHAELSGDSYTPPSPLASTPEGVFLVSSQPPNTHHPTPLLSVPPAHGSKNLPNLYPRRRSLLLHPQQKGTMAFNFHGPWATWAMQEPALQILAAVCTIVVRSRQF